MKRAFGYLRVSKDPKLEKISPEVQRRMIRDYCRERHWELVETLEDVDVPGASFNRPGWQEIRGRLDECDVIVGIDYERFGRSLEGSLKEMRELTEAGKDFVAISQQIDTTTEEGITFRNFSLLMADAERRRLSRRLKQMHSQIAQEGRWKGGGTPPLGYTYTPGSKVLEVNPEEAEVVREIYRLRDSGISIHHIVQEMDSRGARGKRGARFDYSAVAQTLRNPTYLGKRVHRGEIYEGQHEAIVDADLWERVQARRRQGTSGNTRYLASGFLVCGVCGSKMIHQTSASNGHRRGTYVCKRARQFRDTPMVTIEEGLAHAWLTEALFKKLDGKKLQVMKDRARRRAPKVKDKVQKAEAQLKRVEASLERLVSDYYDAERPLLTPEQFRRKNAELLEKREVLEGQLGKLADEARLDNVVSLSERRAREIRESWEGLSLDEQREVLRLFVEKVTVSPREVGGKKLQPGRLRVSWR